MAGRFSITSAQVSSSKVRRNPYLDLRSATSVAQVVDTFYYSTDESLVIDSTEDPGGSGGTISLFNRPDVRRKNLGGGSFWEFFRYPVLRPDPERDGALRWLFGWLGGAPLLDRPEFVSSRRTVAAGYIPAPGQPAQRLVSETLHILGPGGRPGSLAYRDAFGQTFDDHEVVASAVYTEPTAAATQDRLVLFSVERATGFWATTQTIAVNYYDDPAGPLHRLRQVTFIRGIEG
jgi:hypothetical protein